MMDGLNILNEENPFKREIWGAGYTHIMEDVVSDQIILYNTVKEKRINLSEWRSAISQTSFKRGVLPNGKVHVWISEADGSADRFRELIN